MATSLHTPSGATPRWLIAIMALLAVLALAVPILIVRNAPAIAPTTKRVAMPTRVVPKAELPPVEPIAFQDLAPVDAQAFNATVPFSKAPNPAARPFVLTGAEDSRARAIDCLAAAVLYEAGDDPVGERAVAQVVLNRVRHPAYPNTICGVVFQGAERRTGCQFTFTCDGAIMRAVMPAAWERARDIARGALAGRVDARVGHATHYHTDWVVPYWSSSLDKIVEVNTHLFFRWTGWWGTPPAFRSRYAGAEPAIAKLARLSPAHRTSETEAELAAELAAGLILDPTTIDDAAVPRGLEQDQNSFLVTLDPKFLAEDFPAVALKACGDRPYCKFMAWTSKAATPATLPMTPVQQRAMSFSYLRDRAFGFDKALWNCNEFKRREPVQCMKAQLTMTMAAPPPAFNPATALRGQTPGGAPAPAGAAGVEPLAGVRRKVDPATVPTSIAVPKAAAPKAAAPKAPPQDATKD